MKTKSVGLIALLFTSMAALAVVGSLRYWTGLTALQAQELAVERNANEQRARELTVAASQHFDATLRSLDIALQYLRDVYLQNPAGFAQAARMVQAHYPQSMRGHLVVLGADGLPRYGSQARTQRGYQGDSEPFLALAREHGDLLFIGHPEWGHAGAGLQLAVARPLRRGGHFVGTIALEVSARYFTDEFNAFLGSPREVLTMQRGDGQFIARSRQPGGSQDNPLPPGRPYLAATPGMGGIFRDASALDHAPLLFSWRRLQQWPVSVVVAVDEYSHLRLVMERQAQERRGTAVAMALVLLAAGGVGFLLLRLARRNGDLAESERRFRALVEKNGSVMLLVDPENGRIVQANAAAARFYGYPLAALQGKAITEINTLDAQAVAQEMQRARHEERNYFNFRHRLANGELREVEVYSTPIEVQHRTYLFSIVNDITRRRQAEASLRLAASVFTHAREGIMITDARGIIVDVNSTFCEITGYSLEEAVGQTPRLLKSGRHAPEYYDAMWQSLQAQGFWSGEVWNRRKSGEVYAEMQTVSAVRDPEGTVQHYVSLFSDITLLKQHEQELEHIAHYDALTQLPNRVLLADRLGQGLIQSQRRKNLLAVVFIDLDGFKAVNDQHGHAAGDRLLIDVSQRIKAALREGDSLSRLGGDEFVAILPDLDSVQACQPVLARMLQAASSPVLLGEAALQVSASMGVALYPQDGQDADLLMRRADQAMYTAKQAGKNRFHMFDIAQAVAIKNRNESVQRVLQGLAQQEFVLHYQPKVNLRTAAVVGVEALLRWQHPERGLLTPKDFLPGIEDHANSVPLGEWVLQTALGQVCQWQQQGLQLPVSVNVGAYQLQQDDFVQRLGQIMHAHAQAGVGMLQIEVLETSALQDLGSVSRTMQACRSAGVEFALDDFGTGYSSLTYLKHLPAQTLKIDQSFVHDMLSDQSDLAIVSGVIGMARAFGREVIAEGVETPAQCRKLLELGCELAQGYGIARPMPAALLPDWLQHWQRGGARRVAGAALAQPA